MVIPASAAERAAQLDRAEHFFRDAAPSREPATGEPLLDALQERRLRRREMAEVGNPREPRGPGEAAPGRRCGRAVFGSDALEPIGWPPPCQRLLLPTVELNMRLVFDRGTLLLLDAPIGANATGIAGLLW